MRASRWLTAKAPLLLLLGGSALLFTWRLSVSGFANAYYSAAVQAGTQSWKAFFFGSLDAANAITVDKPPLALWPMALCARAFGLNSWTILLPQALEGVAAVALLYLCVQQMTQTRWPAILAGALFALTPVSVLVFRYNNPDALLTVLLLGAAYATLRALEGHRSGAWLALAGTLVGLGFLAKMLEAFLVLPALGLTFLIYGPGTTARRLLQLLGASAAVLLSAGWWVALVELWPPQSRPFIGGSPANSVLELAFGYNGVDRITGTHETTVSSSGFFATNLARIGRTDLGAEITWFVGLAVMLFVLAWLHARKSPATPLLRPGLFMWAGWILTTAATFAMMAGIFHSYYTVILAPALAGVVAVGAWVAWQYRAFAWVRRGVSFALVLTIIPAAIVVFVLGHSLRWWAVVILLTGGAAVALVHPRTGARHLSTPLLVAAMSTVLIGPAVFDWGTINSAHTGSGPMAGPDRGSRTADLVAWRPSTPDGKVTSGYDTINAPVVSALSDSAERFRWVAAVPGARSASAYQLATGKPVLAIGGFKGSDPLPSLEQFTRLVHQGDVHWFITGGTYGPGTRKIQDWVEEHFSPTVIDGRTLYDLTQDGPRGVAP